MITGCLPSGVDMGRLLEGPGCKEAHFIDPLAKQLLLSFWRTSTCTRPLEMCSMFTGGFVQFMDHLWFHVHDCGWFSTGMSWCDLVYAACARMGSETSWMITGCLPSGKGIEALLEASVHVGGFSIIAQVDYRTSSLFFRSEHWMLHSRTEEHSNVDRTYIGQTSNTAFNKWTGSLNRTT
jgi:hypothetical protein